jgi:hypothetical protein
MEQSERVAEAILRFYERFSAGSVAGFNIARHRMPLPAI